MSLSRRTVLCFLAAPAIIRVAEIMPIKPVKADILSPAEITKEALFLLDQEMELFGRLVREFSVTIPANPGPSFSVTHPLALT